jgi:hypothetical protein
MIETAEIIFLKNVERCTLADAVINTVIRDELNMFNLDSTVRNNRLNLIHRVERLRPERMGYIPRRTRSSGRRKLGWKDQRILQKE